MSQKILVAGSGKSGIAASRMALDTEHKVILYDSNEALDAEAVRGQFKEDETIEVLLGELTKEALKDVELCVISPGIPLDAPFVEVLKACEVPIWSEIQLAYHYARGKLAAITGTNGKTTTATLLYELVRLAGEKAGLLSTVCNYIGEEKIPATHTTPDALSIQELLRRMVDAGCRYCFMEASSHAIHQKRIAGLDFDGAIFSNITHDHLDYHKTFKAYIEAKKAFFDRLPAHAFALTNADDKNGLVMLQNTRAHRYTYSCRTMADFTAKAIEKHLDGTLLRLDGEEVWTKFTGDFNAYNLLAVYAAARLLGFTKENVLEYVSLLVPVSGRFETLISTEGVMAVVDYAHTPDAVENVLSTICGLKGRNNQVITVVGAGGDRDKTKRPEMADAACRYSDHVILTSDNPRSEDPEQIIRDMLTGVKEGFQYRVEAITDRKEAIRKAIGMASKGDIILVAGKGHENYQEVKGVKHHFDDKEVIREIFDLSNR